MNGYELVHASRAHFHEFTSCPLLSERYTPTTLPIKGKSIIYHYMSDDFKSSQYLDQMRWQTIVAQEDYTITVDDKRYLAHANDSHGFTYAPNIQSLPHYNNRSGAIGRRALTFETMNGVFPSLTDDQLIRLKLELRTLTPLFTIGLEMYVWNKNVWELLPNSFRQFITQVYPCVNLAIYASILDLLNMLLNIFLVFLSFPLHVSLSPSPN